MEEIDANPESILVKLDAWLDGFIRLIPNVAIALVLLVVFYILARIIAGVIRRAGKRRERGNLGDVAGALIKWIILIAGVLLAITIIAPSVKPADLIGALGIGSVAIGFAFKDILQNMLAGILILLRQPFEVGDQIVVSSGHEGTVERIETRATLIRTYDNRRVVIPNADIYTDVVVVKTAFEKARSQYDVQIGCSDDFKKAKQIMRDTVAGIDGVLVDEGIDTLPWSMDADGNSVRLRWWTASDRASTVRIWGEVIENVYTALDQAGIDLPYPTRVMLFHDQTEATDGKRDEQREGWPAGDGPVPAARPIPARTEGAGD